ncbi:MAG: alpha-glucosidase C-terminal domain-containing protein [Labilithrix sp.]|nr:alpha-glucosidase C-terminal domain-containing protein [Labilithrix sp.]
MQRAYARSAVFALLTALASVPACGGAGSDEAGPAGYVRPPSRPTPEQQASAAALLTGPDWYRHAVFYEVNVRSFQDSNGDGIGDLPGLVSRLDYLKDLGVDALWLMPIMPSPFEDSGYDVADYRAIEPAYGTMADFERLMSEAKARGMRVLIDLVLNHTSDAHPWFQESRKDKTNAKANWYVWSDTAGREDIGCGTNGSTFGDSAWELEPAREQYYFHRFYPGQPDLNYREPEVAKEMLDTTRFWLDKGVDGFRCDVVGLLFETATSCSLVPETIEYIKSIRQIVDGYADRAMVAEPVELTNATPYFGGGEDMFHMAFDFAYGYFWGLAFASGDRRIIEDALATASAFPDGAQNALVIGSHDVLRAWQTAGNDAERYRGAALLQMTMRGTPFIYYGEEVALRPGAATPIDIRDTSRTPMTWTRDGAGHGFTTGTPWLPFGEAPGETSVEAEDADPDSMLSFYRSLLALRRGHAVWGSGSSRLLPLDDRGIVAFVREDEAESYLVAVNLAREPREGTATASLPGRGRVVLGQGSLATAGDAVTVKLPESGYAVFQLRP